ncbi:MAG: 5'/3'-nucleotidase SurE [Campylobacterota bacterium]
MKTILVTNDDGFESDGLTALVQALQPLGRVIVVAPTINKSACGHSLTLDKPLRFVQIEDDFFKLDDGSPSDCVYLSLHSLLEKAPDLIVSGINKGANMGEDITYSGTAAAAMEASLQGVASIAISQVCNSRCEDLHMHGYTLAAQAAYKVAKDILNGDVILPKRRFLNINVPPIVPHECQGYKITKAGHRIYGNDLSTHRNPRGLEYHWIGLHPLEWIPSEKKDCDFEAIKQNYISITPIQMNLTSHEEIEGLQKWIDTRE